VNGEETKACCAAAREDLPCADRRRPSDNSGHPRIAGASAIVRSRGATTRSLRTKARQATGQIMTERKFEETPKTLLGAIWPMASIVNYEIDFVVVEAVCEETAEDRAKRKWHMKDGGEDASV